VSQSASGGVRLGVIAAAVVAVASVAAVVAASVGDGADRRDLLQLSREPADVGGDGLAPPTGYELMFEDDFSGDELGDAWTTCYWWQVDGGCRIHQEVQWYQADAVTVRDGRVELRAERSDEVATDGTPLEYRSGMISTGPERSRDSEPGFEFTYGYVEATVRFPASAGTWPALWLLSADKQSRPEIDIFEWYGARPDLVTSHLHVELDGERRSRRIEHAVDGASDAWHHAAVLWEPDHLEFFFDGVSTGVVTELDLIPDTPMYLIINLALGSAAGDVDAGALPQSVFVDRVRVWQR